MSKFNRESALMLVAGIVALVAGILLTVTSGAKGADFNPPPRPGWMKVPCAEEDSVNCYWNANEQGNGHGASFFARKLPHQNRVCIFYVKPNRAHMSDQCYKP